ncbi:MAG: transglycosylase SLT domain-containing protein [bacterium]|uniref:Transglycosylase SLT domain-containing protein n=1 Tax=Candidatus Aphodosoma intestinipullorum TaxID=2840674 RepID=A0A940IF25_9BACT|nr:transglycosylase SLT domain-containing protein [Candidatus Aphodosoma intestinipullorum]
MNDNALKYAVILLIAVLFPLCASADDDEVKAGDVKNALGLDVAEYDSLCAERDAPADTGAVYTAYFDRSLDSLVHEWFVVNTFAAAPCDTSDTVIRYPDSVYIARLQQLPYIMEMPFNSIVKSYIEMYARRHKQVGYMLGIGEAYYFPMFEQTLAKYNVPLELKYLPVIESALNARAVSPAGASGLWQFMVSTGRIYGLEVNSLVDERRDPRKSTDAAARYLSDLYQLYGDWHLVIAAYNCGPGNVAKAIRAAGGKKDYWSIYPYLPRETRGYVPIFIAANYIMNNYASHGICPAVPQVKGLTDTVMITDRVHLQQIADKLAIPLDELRFLNPQYRYDIIPGNIKAYPLVLPLDEINSYALNRDSILAYRPELAKRQVKVDPAGYGSGDVIYYRVKSGDTLGGIALKYRVTVSQLKRWNGIRGTLIRAGQRLRIYK